MDDQLKQEMEDLDSELKTLADLVKWSQDNITSENGKNMFLMNIETRRHIAETRIGLLGLKLNMALLNS